MFWELFFFSQTEVAIDSLKAFPIFLNQIAGLIVR